MFFQSATKTQQKRQLGGRKQQIHYVEKTNSANFKGERSGI